MSVYFPFRPHLLWVNLLFKSISGFLGRRLSPLPFSFSSLRQSDVLLSVFNIRKMALLPYGGGGGHLSKT